MDWIEKHWILSLVVIIGTYMIWYSYNQSQSALTLGSNNN